MRAALITVRTVFGKMPFAVLGLSPVAMTEVLSRCEIEVSAGRLPADGAAEVAVSEEIAREAFRLAAAKLGKRSAVTKLFKVLAPAFASRVGGYTRVIKLGPRQSDSAPMAFLEWTELPAAADAPVVEAPKPARKTAARKKKTDASE